jgi:hypothetical protein
MPIRDVCSPINKSKGRGSERIKHTNPYGPATSEHSDAARPTSRPSSPSEVVDGTLTIKHTGNRGK